MIEPGIFYPSRLTGTELDVFLSMGWYRMGQGIFTTHGIVQQDQVYRVFWLRYDLQQLAPPKKSTKKITESCSHFEAIVRRLNVTQEMEDLYEVYKAGIQFCI